MAYPRFNSHTGEVAIYNLLSRKVETVITTGLFPVSVDWSKRVMLAILFNNCRDKKAVIREQAHYFANPIYLFHLTRSVQ